MATIDARLDALLETANRVILGKQGQIRLALACLLARGHLLIEDVPGVGKTTLAHLLSKLLGLEFQRIQFTSDLLPADILGVSVFDRDAGEFRFHPGPIFARLILADEINRATPKTQSALLEAMEERQVTADGRTRPLPEPFFVIATQNPAHQIGTFPLPESQLDRFLMRISIGYPDRDAERAILAGATASITPDSLGARITREQLHRIQQEAARVAASALLLDYVQRLVAFSRTAPGFAQGLSPRGALALMAAARSWAYMEGRTHVVPEDVQAVLRAVTAHRLRPGADFEGDGRALVDRLLREVDVFG